MTASLWLQPVLAGLSSGIFCTVSCAPFLASVLASEERGWNGSFRFLLKFLFGRFAGYLAFGLAAGLAAENLRSPWRAAASDFSLAVLALILLTTLWLQPKPRCQPHAFRRTAPALMGFVMGVNVCPPFLASVAFIFSVGQAVYGVFYFVLFFIASSVYLLPLAAAGRLGRWPEFRLAARWGGFAAGFLFLAHAGISLYRRWPEIQGWAP